MHFGTRFFIGLAALAFGGQAASKEGDEKIWIFVSGLDLKRHCEASPAFCAGYIASISDSIAVLAQSDRAPSLCIPQTAQLEQLVLVVTKYLSANPDKLHINGATLSSRAIIDAFPCSPLKRAP